MFVGNLSFDATEDDVAEAFAEVGQVVECEILGARNGRSKGCALVTVCQRVCLGALLLPVYLCVCVCPYFILNHASTDLTLFHACV